MPRDDSSFASVPAAWRACFPAALLLVVAVAACAGDEPDTFEDVFSDLNSEYTRPIVNAAPPVACEAIDPETENPDCAVLVATIEDISPALDSAIGRLRDIRDGGNPREAEELASMNDVIVALVFRDYADQLVIEGWKDKDIDRWREGWALQREAGEIWFGVLDDIYRFLDQSESPSASE
ncbi:MAG TPA: hypothetical protein VIT93_03755 [Dehalococcoidia bacterium]